MADSSFVLPDEIEADDTSTDSMRSKQLDLSNRYSKLLDIIADSIVAIEDIPELPESDRDLATEWLDNTLTSVSSWSADSRVSINGFGSLEGSAVELQLKSLWDNIMDRVQRLLNDLKGQKKLLEPHRYPLEISELIRLLQNTSSAIEYQRIVAEEQLESSNASDLDPLEMDTMDNLSTDLEFGTMYSGAARGFPAHEELHDQSLSEARPPDTGGNPSENPGERRTQTLLPAPDLDESLKEDQSQQPESELPKRNLLALVLKTLMQKIGSREEDDAEVFTSFHPHEFDKNCSRVGRRAVTDNTNDIFDRARNSLNNDRATDEVVEARKAPKEQRYLPCHYFDYIGGSSTGAFIALMLGRLRMPVADCLDEYELLSGRVFGHPNHVSEIRFPFPFVTRPKFNDKRLLKAVNDVVNRRKPANPGEQQRFPFYEDLCKTYAISFKTQANIGQITLLRSYKHERMPLSQQPTPLYPSAQTHVSTLKSRKTDDSEHSGLTSTMSRPSASPQRSDSGFTTRSSARRTQVIKKPIKRFTNYGPATDWDIVRVARVATAAETYFRPVEDKEEGEKVTYTDGSFSHSNNPTIEGIEDIRERYGEQSVGIVVSVGTAQPQSSSQIKRRRFPGRRKEWSDTMIDPRLVHHRVKEESRDNNFGFPYFRFNAKKDLALHVSLDEWEPRSRPFKPDLKTPGSETRAEMDRRFLEWVRQIAVQDQLDQCAKRLVESRRDRMTREAEWERFAICARYECNEVACFHDQAFFDKDKFYDHLRDQHPHLVGNDLFENVIKQRRKKWEYQSR